MRPWKLSLKYFGVGYTLIGTYRIVSPYGTFSTDYGRTYARLWRLWMRVGVGSHMAAGKAA